MSASSARHRTRPPSLRRRLLAYALIAVSGSVIAMSIVIYRGALRYTNQFYDEGLVEDAQALARIIEDSAPDIAISSQARFLIEYGQLSRNYFAIRSSRRGLLAGADLEPPRTAARDRVPLLYDTTIAGARGRGAAIAFRAANDPGDRITVTLVESTVVRMLRARQILAITAVSQASLILVVVIALWIGFNRALRMLEPLGEALSRRGQDMSAIDEAQVPVEVAPLTRTINALFDRIRDLFLLQEQFLADAAHQLRTPLAGLSLQSERALRAQSDPERNAALARIPPLAMRTARIASQLLALTRAQAPVEHPMQPAVQDLAKLVPDMLAGHVDRALERGIELTYDGPHGAIVSNIDAHALHEVLDNLLDNALRFTGPGGTVAVVLAADPDGICIRVDDDGPGVPEHLLAQLGNRFFRIPAAADGGTGLGLAIVQRIVERHAGRVGYSRSRLGGLGVEIRLPASESSPVAH